MIDVFTHLGLSWRGFPRRYIGSETGDLLIVGGGRCVWEDVRGLSTPTHTMCVNDIGMHWPGTIRHWYSNDVEQLVHWAQGRKRQYAYLFGGSGTLHSCCVRDNLPQVLYWPFAGQGSSGLVAIFVAMALGYSDIVVAGMPFDNSGHYFDPPESHNLKRDRTWSNFLNETPDELLTRALPLMRGRVRAMSGRLKEALG